MEIYEKNSYFNIYKEDQTVHHQFYWQNLSYCVCSSR